MRRLLLVLLLGCMVMVVGGCGMMMNKEYSARLDGDVEWSAEKVKVADLESATAALQENEVRWRAFKDASGPWLGVSDVWLNATYSQLLDKTIAWATDQSKRASGELLSLNEAKDALLINHELWKLFRDSKEGVAPEEDKQ